MVFLYEGGFSMIVISFRMCCDERRLAFVWTANCGRYIPEALGCLTRGFTNILEKKRKIQVHYIK